MGKPTGFLEAGRELPSRRSVPVRLRDWKEVYEPLPGRPAATQASRCMDCGIPFCNDGCPLGNLIPDWNDLVYRDHWHAAIERLHATNNFPEFTGRLCPAPCEAACVLGINSDPVTIKQVEVSIIDRAWDEGWVTPVLPSVLTGPAGGGDRLGAGRSGRRPAADPGRPRRHRVRARRPARRAAALRDPRVQDGEAVPRPPAGADAGRGDGVRVRGHGAGPAPTAAPSTAAGRGVPAATSGPPTTPSSWRWAPPCRATWACRAGAERHPPGHGVPAAGQPGGRVRPTRPSPPRSRAAGKRVVIIGGGDTGADCLGPCTAKARCPCTSSRSCPGRPTPATRRRRGRPGR